MYSVQHYICVFLSLSVVFNLGVSLLVYLTTISLSLLLFSEGGGGGEPGEETLVRYLLHRRQVGWCWPSEKGQLSFPSLWHLTPFLSSPFLHAQVPPHPPLIDTPPAHSFIAARFSSVVPSCSAPRPLPRQLYMQGRSFIMIISFSDSCAHKHVPSVSTDAWWMIPLSYVCMHINYIMSPRAPRAAHFFLLPLSFSTYLCVCARSCIWLLL